MLQLIPKFYGVTTAQCPLSNSFHRKLPPEILSGSQHLYTILYVLQEAHRGTDSLCSEGSIGGVSIPTS